MDISKMSLDDALLMNDSSFFEEEDDQDPLSTDEENDLKHSSKKSKNGRNGKNEVVHDHENAYEEEEDDLENRDLGKSNFIRNENGNGNGRKSKERKGFYAFDISKQVMSGIKKLGYKAPTPIQKKTLPIALAGKDLVAMARTGSGKTAAFLIPTIDRLGEHSSTVGVRAVILSPTRELAQQTYKFTRQIAHFTSIRSCLLQGGDKMEAQFEALASNPDILVATPGRLVHLLGEIPDFSLTRVEVLILDEADRMFESGFAMQLNEILLSCAEERQTLLFSATMPRQLVEFARAGLREPELIRLDTETKISDKLKLVFFSVRPEEKLAALIFLLSQFVREEDQTVVFAETKHHVEYIGHVLREVAGIESSMVYGTMEMQARSDNLEQFRMKKKKILVVTDVAARGLDIPLLNNVVNFGFPYSAKLFVHRVGRAARQGADGVAYSLVAPDEEAFLFDTLLYLGRSLQFPKSNGMHGKDFNNRMANDDDHGFKRLTLEEMKAEDTFYGRFPRSILDEENERIQRIVSSNPDIETLEKSASNAYKLYKRTRPEPSKRSIKRTKEIENLSIHPLLLENAAPGENLLDQHLGLLRNFRPKQTVFEVEASKVSNAGQNSNIMDIMKQKRYTHESVISKKKELKAMDDLQHTNDEADPDDKIRGNETGIPSLSSKNLNTKKNPSQSQTQITTNSVLQSLLPGLIPKRNEQEKGPRVSKAARKALKKRKRREVSSDGRNQESIDGEDQLMYAPVSNATQHQSHGSDLKSKNNFKTDFRDPKLFVSPHPESFNAEVESHLSVNRKQFAESSGNGVMGESRPRLEDALLDLAADDQISLAQQQRVHHWDKRKKKYVKATLQEHAKAKRIRNESGAIVQSAKNRGEIYKRWQRESRKQISSEGSSLDDSTKSRNGSENFDEENRSAVTRDLHPKQKTDVRTLAKKLRREKNSDDHTKNELKTADVIRKERREKVKGFHRGNLKRKEKELEKKQKSEFGIIPKLSKSKFGLKRKSDPHTRIAMKKMDKRQSGSFKRGRGKPKGQGRR